MNMNIIMFFLQKWHYWQIIAYFITKLPKENAKLQLTEMASYCVQRIPQSS